VRQAVLSLTRYTMRVSFAKNTAVRILSLKKEGVIVGISRPGYYAVAVGNLKIECTASDLQLIKQKKEVPSSIPVRKTNAKSPSSKVIPSLAVDLHGMTVEQALSLVERTLDRALSSGIDRVDLVHGIGTGKLKSAIHRYLSGLSVVKRYKLSDGNPGITWVFF